LAFWVCVASATSLSLNVVPDRIKLPHLPTAAWHVV
jgi:hypothetical protein